MVGTLCRMAAAVCGVLALIPLLFYGIFNAGSILLLAFGLILGGLSFLWDAFPDRSFPGYPRPPRRWWRMLRGALAGLLATAVMAGAVLSLPMLTYGWFHPPEEGEPCTVVVPGCRAKAGEPSTMLRRRLDAALEYLEGHPGAPVVVTGGLDEGESLTEADAAESYLIRMGLDPERIYKETTSSSTRENMENAAAVIRKEALPSRVVIVTDGFHQWRSAGYARMAELEAAGAISSSTPWGLLPIYWVREMAALVKLYVFGR